MNEYKSYSLKYPDTEKNWMVWYERQPVVPQPPRTVPRPTSAAPRGKVVNEQQTGMGEAQVKPKRKQHNRKNNQPQAGVNVEEKQRKDSKGKLVDTLKQFRGLPPPAGR